jgi:hypothetical protein
MAVTIDKTLTHTREDMYYPIYHNSVMQYTATKTQWLKQETFVQVCCASVDTPRPTYVTDLGCESVSCLTQVHVLYRYNS